MQDLPMHHMILSGASIKSGTFKISSIKLQCWSNIICYWDVHFCFFYYLHSFQLFHFKFNTNCFPFTKANIFI